MSSFEGVVPALAEALTSKNYTTLTPVQRDVLAPELRDADLLVSAQTGSGKTVAFGMSLAPTLMGDEDRLPHTRIPMALVVAPTRELALQVKRELEWLYAGAGAKLASCVGGMDMRTERQVLGRGAHIVVGTPGRLRDHIQRGSLDMSEMKAVVLDEADEMLDLGFREDLEFILDAAPAERRTLMFSATVPRPIVSLAKRFQRNAVRLETTTEQRQHNDIEYRALTVAPSDRENAIINVLRYFEAKSAIVFCATRESVNRMTSRFTNRGFSVVALSGELSQSQRTHALQSMRDGRARVCIATDVAARGLDLPDLELVIHSDLPQNSPALLHRSGRTGRAGRKGVSVLIVPYSARFRAERLLQGARIEATWAGPPSAKEINERDDQRLLEDPTLTEPVAETETDFVGQILALHSPEQIAAAFVRLYRAGQSAPEDLQENPKFKERGKDRGETRGDNRGEKHETKRKARVDFEGSSWFSLSVGHRQNAETRWLLPMLYKAGNVSKGDVGAIKVYGGETHVEIAATSVERFEQAIGPNKTVEKGINVAPIEGTPVPPDDMRSPPAERPARVDNDDNRPRAAERPPRNKRETESTGAYAGSKPRKTRAHHDEAVEEKPDYIAADAPPRSKKTYKPKPSKDGADDDRGERGFNGGADTARPKAPFKPRSDKPYAGKPKSDKPYAGKPKSDKPYAGKPKPDKPYADRPKSDKPYAGKPKSGKPKSATTGSSKTGLGKPGGKFRGVAGRAKDGTASRPYKGKGPKSD